MLVASSVLLRQLFGEEGLTSGLDLRTQPRDASAFTKMLRSNARDFFVLLQGHARRRACDCPEQGNRSSGDHLTRPSCTNDGFE